MKDKCNITVDKTNFLPMKIIECPRDAMQGITEFIPTADKIRYLNKLLTIGFDTLDFGSFVSPKSIPQMRDTKEVLGALDAQASQTKLLAIVANMRGAEEAGQYDSISFLGFPLSISETFQVRNTNKSISEALNTLEQVKEICIRKNKKLVTYISMGFGNPYGDPYDAAMVSQFAGILLALGSDVISLADTIGAATAEDVGLAVKSVLREFPDAEIGVHLHAAPADTRAKLKAAFDAGCRRFDGALKGFGGCPMAKDELVGNMATEEIIDFLESQCQQLNIDMQGLNEALALATEIFPKR
jgi:hydroxymethylglutaryl-CoA lyase